MTIRISNSCMGNHDAGRDNLFRVAHGFVELQQTESKPFPGPSN